MSRSGQSPPRAAVPVHPNGFAYFMVLAIISIVAMVAVAMGRAFIVRARASEAAQARVACRAAALGILRAGLVDMGADAGAGSQPRLNTLSAKGEMLGACGVVLVGRDPLGLAPVQGPISEAGKIDVNAASLTTLAALPGMTTALAAAIIDWRDADDIPEPAGGAERSLYSVAQVPYSPRNAPLESLEELRLVYGMTDTIYFGEDTNQNGVLDLGEDRNGDGKLQRGLRDLLTLDSREPALRPDGTPKIEVTAVRGDLRTLLQDTLGEDRGTEVYNLARQHRPYANRMAFCKAAELTATEINLLWPHISGLEGRVGLIDAYAAPEEVLSAVLGQAGANRVMAARPAVQPEGPGWLVFALSQDELNTWGNSLTSGSYQFTFDILAFSARGQGFSRLNALADFSTSVPRVVKLTPADTTGWPYPWIIPADLRGSGLPLEGFFQAMQQKGR